MSGWKFPNAGLPYSNYIYRGAVGDPELWRGGCHVTVKDWEGSIPHLDKWGAGVPAEEPGQPHSIDCPEKPLPVPLADANPKSVQGAKKFPLRYLPLPAAVEVNRALADGEVKYGAANWRKTGVAASVYVDACLRHLLQWYDGGQERASDSGVHNLGHAMACLAILMDAQHVGKLVDDRPTPITDSDALLLRATE